MERYLQSVDPGHSLHLVNIWLYDDPQMLNTAVALGLTDDQWGMVKERGFSVGPWYLAIPAVFHIYFPAGTTGTGFILWNLGFAVLLMFAVPLIPGLRDLPKVLRIYRFIYRYPKPGELDQPAMRERHGPVHGGQSHEPEKAWAARRLSSPPTRDAHLPSRLRRGCVRVRAGNARTVPTGRRD